MNEDGPLRDSFAISRLCWGSFSSLYRSSWSPVCWEDVLPSCYISFYAIWLSRIGGWYVILSQSRETDCSPPPPSRDNIRVTNPKQSNLGGGVRGDLLRRTLEGGGGTPLSIICRRGADPFSRRKTTQTRKHGWSRTRGVPCLRRDVVC